MSSSQQIGWLLVTVKGIAQWPPHPHRATGFDVKLLPVKETEGA